MHYQECIPTAALRPYIKCYWLLVSDDKDNHDFEKIIPDGSPELIIHLGVPFYEKMGGEIHQQQRAFVYGQLKSSISIKPSSHARVLGIKFHPYGLCAFTRIPQQELACTTHSITNTFTGFNYELYLDQMMHVDNGSLFGIVDGMMLALLKQTKEFESSKVDKVRLATLQLKNHHGNIRIDELKRLTNMSTRELERKFNTYVGLSPKQLARIYRLQYAMQMQSQAALLTHLALDAGYFDQAHFIREFSNLVNATPSEYFKLQSELSDKFLLKVE